jgi:arylsulfatase A-like enzyme
VSRTTSRRLAGVLALLAVTNVSATGCVAGEAYVAPARAAEDPRPNVLMITVDDASPLNLEYMPNVRRLIADRGVTLTNAVAPTPICVPARASLLTGQYAHNHGTHTISGPHGGFGSFDDRETLPVWLSTAGYDTLFVGKYLNGYGESRPSRRYVPPGWSNWRATVGKTTYNYVAPTVNVNGRVRKVRKYSSDLFSRYTVDLLTQKRRRQSPWFMMVNYVAPHAGGPREADDPLVRYPGTRHRVTTPRVAARHRDAYADLGLPTTPDMFESDTRDKARASHTAKQWSLLGRRKMQEGHQQRVESLLAVDEAVAKAVRALRRTGQLANTVITFSSDNGYLVGQHNRQSKLIHYEESLKVPMLIAGPGIPRGKRVATQVTNADLPATIAALAGATPTRTVDGVDIRPLLRQPRRDRVVPIQAWQVQDGNRRVYRGVRTDRWTYVRFADGEEELFDHADDPYQLSNLAGRRALRGPLRRMRTLTSRYNSCAGPSCRG